MSLYSKMEIARQMDLGSADPWSIGDIGILDNNQLANGPGIRTGMVSVTITACGRTLPGADLWSIASAIGITVMDLGSARPMSDCIFICMRVRGVSWSGLRLTQRVGRKPASLQA